MHNLKQGYFRGIVQAGKSAGTVWAKWIWEQD